MARVIKYKGTEKIIYDDIEAACKANRIGKRAMNRIMKKNSMRAGYRYKLEKETAEPIIVIEPVPETYDAPMIENPNDEPDFLLSPMQKRLRRAGHL